MTDYPAVLTALYPDARWSMGATYDTLVWHSEGKKPTQKKLDDAWPQVEWERTVAEIRAARERRYRNETDPMFFQFQRNEGDITLADWQAAVQQIRDDLPYPEAP